MLSEREKARDTKGKKGVGVPSRIELERENEQLKQQVEQLDALHEIGRLITSALELDEVLSRVVEAAVLITKAEEGSIMLLDEQTNELHVRAQKGLGERYAQTLGLSVDDSLAGNVLRTGKSMRLSEEAKVVTGYIVNAIMYVPLVCGERRLGVLSVDNREAGRSFSKDDEHLLSVLADYAAIAIENARLVEDLRERTQALTSLHTTGRSMLSALTLDKVLSQIARSALEVLGADIVTLYEYDRKRDDVIVPPIFQGEVREPEVSRYRGSVTPYRQSIVFEVIRREKPFYAQNAKVDWAEAGLVGPPRKAEGEAFVEREGIVSSAGIPLIAGGETVGIMFVNYRAYQQFTAEARGTIEIFANQAAIAIQNARLFERAQRHTQELSALYDVSLDITRQLELEPLLQAIVKGAAKLLGAPAGGLLLCEADKKEMVMRVTHGLDPLRGVKFKFGQGMAGRVAQSGKPMIASNYHTWEGRDQRFDEEPYSNLFRAVVQVPLKWQDEVIGVLAISDVAEDRTFDENDIQFLEGFANQAAIAIQNATLFNKKVRELEASRQATAALLSTMDLEEMLQTILDELSNLIECDCIVIRLWDEEKRELVLKAQGGDYLGKIPTSRSIGMGISGRAAEARKPVVSNDVSRDPGHRKLVEATQDPEGKFLGWIRSEAAVPLIARDKLIGVLSALTPKKDGFQEADIQLMESFARQAAIALHNAQLIQRSRQHTVLVAHQLKGPLQAIRGDVDYQLSYIRRTYRDDERLNRLHRRIGEHFGRLNNELDNFSFLIRGDLRVGHKYSMKVQPIIHVIVEAAAQFKEVAQSRGIEINIDRSLHGLPRVRFDRENMFTVFTNLIDNAVKYSHTNKTVDIKGERQGNRIIIGVADFGLGILPDDRDRIFELYTQGRLKDERRFVQGTGIGLWVAKQIVKAHGGDIKVWSQLFDHPELASSEEDVVGRGFITQFAVELPI